MKQYQVIISPAAEEDLERTLDYLLNVKYSPQAAANVADDYDDTIELLETVAGMLKICEEPRLAAKELRRIDFKRHRYFLLYYIEGDTAYVSNLFHELQDYEGKLT